MATSSQQPAKPGGSPAGKNRQGFKSLVVTASLAATLGGWALLAEHVPVNTTVQSATLIAPRIVASSDAATGMPPLPTLVPPPPGLSLTSLAGQPTEVAQPTPLPEPTLRAVNQAPPQKVVHVGGGGNGGNGGSTGGPAAVAQTSSST